MQRWLRIALIVVLVLVGIAAAGAAALWKLSQPVRPRVVVAPPETTVTPIPTPAPIDTTPVMISDAELATLLERPGVLVPGEKNEARFFFLDSPDPSLPVLDFGFLKARSLLDSTVRVELLSGNERPKRVGFGDRAAIQLELRRQSSCKRSIDLDFAETIDRTSWEIGIRPAVAEVVLDGLRTVSDSLTDAEAMRLINLVPVDSGPLAAGLPPAKVFEPVALRPLASRFIVGNDEYIYVESSRARRLDTLVDTVTMRLRLVEERMVIGERRQGTTAPFSLAWTRYSAYDERETASEAPLMLMRVGPRRVPAILFRRRYGDAIGGKILSRVSPGRWSVVAEWFSGC